MKHTKLPWECSIAKLATTIFYPAEHQEIYNIRHDELYVGQIGADPMNKGKSNAEFIVRACNCYDELTEALETVIAKDENMFVQISKDMLFNSAPELKSMIENVLAKATDKLANEGEETWNNHG